MYIILKTIVPVDDPGKVGGPPTFFATFGAMSSAKNPKATWLSDYLFSGHKVCRQPLTPITHIPFCQSHFIFAQTFALRSQ